MLSSWTVASLTNELVSSEINACINMRYIQVNVRYILSKLRYGYISKSEVNA